MLYLASATASATESEGKTTRARRQKQIRKILFMKEPPRSSNPYQGEAGRTGRILIYYVAKEK
jgi:hypothetical protein